jgi:hypothetical protein
MCTTKLFKSSNCLHSWLVIDIPCGPGKGFSNCKTFSNNPSQISSAPKNYRATKEDCPWHGLKGAYDFNQIRVTEDIKYHIFGGPGRKERRRGRKRRRRGRERCGPCRLFVVR